MINSIKNVAPGINAAATGANTVLSLAIAVDTPITSASTQVKRGCKIFKFWFEMWIGASATAAAGVTQQFDGYIMKNPGANLTPPNPGSVGSSNEKKFVFRTWKGLVGSRVEGTPYYSFRGWIKIPKVYQRFGTDDVLQLVIRPSGTAVIVCHNAIYKWFT